MFDARQRRPPTLSSDATRRRPALTARETIPEVPLSKRRSSNPPDRREGPQIQGRPVLVVGQDPVAVGPLAREILRRGWAIRTAHDEASWAAATAEAAPFVIVLAEKVALDRPRALSALLRERPEIPVVVHGCAKAILAQALVRALGARTVLGIEGSSSPDIVSAIEAVLA